MAGGRMTDIKRIDDIDLRETGSRGLKEMGLYNIVEIWEPQLPEDTHSIEYCEREGEHTSTFDFDKIDEIEDEDKRKQMEALTSYISITQSYFQIREQDYKRFKEEGEL